MIFAKKNILGLILTLVFMEIIFPLSSDSISQKLNHFSLYELAGKDEFFDDFKSNSQSGGVFEHLSYETGKDYLKLIKRDYPDLISLFDRFRQNDSLGQPCIFDYEDVGYLSPTTLRYIKIAGDLRKQFGDLSHMKIVEIGGGYGGQCKIIADLCGFASYTIVDPEECISLSNKYLNALNVKNVSFTTIENLDEELKFDLVISNYIFSEFDVNEQDNFINKIIKYTPNGYMTMNYISADFNIESHPIEELLIILFKSKVKGKIESEHPRTHPNNILLTWYNKRPSMTCLEVQLPLTKSPNLQVNNAITYTFSGGRLGDNLIAYFHAKWLSYKYGLSFIYKPFDYSDQFSLDDMDYPIGDEFLFKEEVTFTDEDSLPAKASSTLISCPYFPETRGEFEWCTWCSYLPFFNVDWEDVGFKEIVKKCLKPKFEIELFNPPSEYMTIAIHIRRGSEASHFTRMTFPLKFIEDDYYIEQIRRIRRLFPKNKLYIYIFTDDSNPASIASRYASILKDTKIIFDYQKYNGLMEDFFAISKFDCCILCQSNFSVVASKLGNYSILICPVHTVWNNNLPLIDEIELYFDGKAGKKKIKSE